MKKIVFLFLSMIALKPLFAADAIAVPEVAWGFKKGPYDRAALQRGFQVYKEVCAACHSLELVNYRNLRDIGFSEAEVKALARDAEMIDGISPDGSEVVRRKAKPSDPLVKPYYSEQAARDANNGALPVDLSLITKARLGGPDYLHALLTGYHQAPEGFEVPEGMTYNAYFPGHLIAMPAPIATDGQVEYADGTNATIDQMSRDVTTFLMWAADPHMESRKQMGIKVLLFLTVLTLLLFLSKRKVWKKLK